MNTVPSRGYLVCAIPRTGSSVLSELLTRTGVAGHPIEYFNPKMQSAPRMRTILGDSNLVDGFSKILAAGTTPNGVFGAKIHWSAMLFFGTRLLEDATGEAPSVAEWIQPTGEAADVGLRNPPDLKIANPRAAADAAITRLKTIPNLRFIHLSRENMVARAISHLRAIRTDRWHHSQAKGVDLQSEPAPQFNFDDIHSYYLIGRRQEMQWQRFFTEYGISRHRIIYEDLVSNFAETIRSVLDFLEIESQKVVIPPPRSKKMSDDVSAEWEVRYRALCKEAGIIL